MMAAATTAEGSSRDHSGLGSLVVTLIIVAVVVVAAFLLRGGDGPSSSPTPKPQSAKTQVARVMKPTCHGTVCAVTVPKYSKSAHPKLWAAAYRVDLSAVAAGLCTGGKVNSLNLYLIPRGKRLLVTCTQSVAARWRK